MTLNRSYIVAALAVLGIVLWFAVNTRGGAVDVQAETGPTQSVEAVVPRVVVRPSTAQARALSLTTYGRTTPHRRVEVKARTAGPVVSTPVAEGATVAEGTVICRQDTDARQAVVDQARAAVAKAEVDLEATTRLVERGFKSATQLPADRANLDAARAQLRQARTELDNIVMRAPFRGVFDMQMAEVGDYLAPGQPCGLVVELDPLVVEAELGETQVGKIELGQDIAISLATGESVDGVVTFIESQANPQTRTFRIEADVPNPDFALKAGVSATLDLPVGEAEAHRVPAGVLTLNDLGETGVRHLDAGDRVRFSRVEVVDETPDGVWVTGLPTTTRVIVEGQDFASEGTRVEARSESGALLNETSPLAQSRAAGG